MVSENAKGKGNMVGLAFREYEKLKNKEIKKLDEKFDIYYIKETGLGFKGEDGDNAEQIDIESAIGFLNEHGTDAGYEDDLLDDGINYLVIYDCNQYDGIPGLAIPEILCDYLKKKGYIEELDQKIETKEI